MLVVAARKILSRKTSNWEFCPLTLMAQRVRKTACNAGDVGLIPGLGRSPGEGNSNPLTVFLPGESHGQRSRVGYSPWGHKESDTTEHSC